MFYNYDEYITPELLKVSGGIEQLWGCSIGSAGEIRNKFFKKRTTPPMFRDMHPGICWPFYQLFEFLNTNAAHKGIANILDGFDLASLTRYRIDEILDDPRFSDLTSPEALGFVDHFEKAPSILINESKLLHKSSEFNPRFRILFTKHNLNNGRLQYLD